MSDTGEQKISLTKSLLFQTGLVYAILGLLNVTFVSIMIFENQTDLLLENFQNKSDAAARSILANTGQIILGRQSPEAYARLDAILAKSKIDSYLVFDTSGAIWHEKGTRTATVPEEWRRKALEIGSSSTEFHERYHLNLSSDFKAELFIPFSTEEKSDVYLRTVFSLSDIEQKLRELYYQAALAAAWVLAFHVLFAIFAIRLLFGRIRTLTARSELLATGDLSARADWTMNRKDELDLLGSTFNVMADRIQETVTKITHLNDEIQNELEIGKEVQEKILPDAQILKEMKAHVFYKPLREVSGDIYGFYRMDNGEKCVFLADAAGHGVSAALITSIATMSLENILPGKKTAESIFFELNNVLASKLRSSLFFMSGVVLVIDAKGLLHFVNAGHPPPVILRPSTGKTYELEAQAPPLGIVAEQKYSAGEFVCLPGDRIIIFSDGLVETEGEGGLPFGYDGVQKALLELMDHSPAALLEELVKRFSGHAVKYTDDITILVMEIQ